MKKFLLITTAALTLVACSTGKRERFNDIENQVDVTPITIHRLDQAVRKMDAKQIQQQVKQLQQTQPGYAQLWLNSIGMEGPLTPDMLTELASFLQYDNIQKMHADEDKQFADISDIQDDVSKAFAYLHKLDTTTQTPKLFLFVSGFDTKAIKAKDTIGLSTDYYLGADYELYKETSYKYERPLFDRAYMSTDFLSCYLTSKYPFHMKQNRLLEHIIYYGRLKYLLSVIFPTHDYWQILGYTKEQWDWCVDNEKAAWGYLLDQKYLFVSDNFTIQQFIGDAPFTQPLTQDSPGRMGVWFGYRIVESYMETHPEVTMMDLMQERDAQKILSNSNYHP